MAFSPNLSGILCMVASTAVFVIGDSFLKIVTYDLPPFEVLFLRGIWASIACAVLVIARGEWPAIAGMSNLRVLARAGCETASTLCYIVGLANLPIADIIALLQTAPLVMILGAVVFLRDKIGPARVALVLAGFAGGLMVAQPGTTSFTPISLLGFASAFMIAARDLIGRGVPSQIPVTVVGLATTLMVMAVAGAMSLGLESWVAPTSGNLGFLALAGLSVAAGQLGLLLAYRLGDTGSVAPFFYTFAIWGVVAGLVVWGELPNALALAGIALIVVSGALIVVIDQRRRAVIPLTEAL